MKRTSSLGRTAGKRGMPARLAAKRFRRTHEEARSEILDAVEAALAEQDFGALSVERLMKHTGMVRSAFYHYFDTLEDVALGILERFEFAVADSSATWLAGDESGDPEASSRVNLAKFLEV